MRSEKPLIAGAISMVAVAGFLLVVVPFIQLKDVGPPKGLHPYTTAQQRGRDEYIRQGCLYCHSQQPRDRSQAPDGARGWGRPSVAGDYYYDRPHLLGTMRTGPDLLNIGARQPSLDWHLGHLYQPRAYVPGSIMPGYPFLFDVKDSAEPGERAVSLPPGAVPAGKVVVAQPRALDLAAYLVSLDRTYPVIETARP
jgi:cytochrome c oxidase cbb3-type subunit 2